MKKSAYAYLHPTSLYVIIAALLLLPACKGKEAAADDDAPVKSITPVSVVNVSDTSLVDYTYLNAISSFQQKSYIKSNANGYIQDVNAHLGSFVNTGQVLFTIKTKEAQTIGNTINVLDTTFRFSGVNRIKAAQHGFITQLMHQKGDYVQDGEQLAIISDRSSFAFLMQLPYEMRQLIGINHEILLTLPDGTKLDGKVASLMPSVDTLAQTQGVVIKVNTSQQIPENLVARARIIKSAKTNTLSLPKSALLSNETQTDFWVMKLINDSTAIKVPVTKGMESGDKVEIVSPKFSTKDRIVVTGNYGLADTAKVKITKP
jgi:multidrug efflux pump subunit AcrA (membrane-fusion protein)